MLYSIEKLNWGYLYVPTSRIKAVVVVFHGSEGGGSGYHNWLAQLLACHGYVVLAYTYCGSPYSPVKGVPSAIININLQSVFVALQLLQDRFTGYKLFLYGVSRGAELALLVATLAAQDLSLPQVDAVAVHSASNRIVMGFDWLWKPYGTKPPNRRAIAWFYTGHNLKPGRKIRIERFLGPVHLTHGKKDTLWKIKRSRKIENRLRKHGRIVETLYLPKEEHILSPEGNYTHLQAVISFYDRNLSQ